MTRIYMDATTLIALGTIGELALLESFDGTPVVLPSIRRRSDDRAAETNLERLCERDSIGTAVPDLELDDESKGRSRRARYEQGCPQYCGSARSSRADDRVAIVSDDRRLRTVADGLGATVTGTIGVIVSAVEAGLSEDDAKTVVRRVDEHGLHRRYGADATGLDPVRKPPLHSTNHARWQGRLLPTRKLLLDIGGKCESADGRRARPPSNVKLDVPKSNQTRQPFSEWGRRGYCITISKGRKTQFLPTSSRKASDAPSKPSQAASKLKQGKKTSQPEFDVWSVVYDKRSATFNDDHATLSTPNGRVTVEYVLRPGGREETPLGRYYGADDWDASSATLQYDEQDDVLPARHAEEPRLQGWPERNAKPGHVMTPARTGGSRRGFERDWHVRRHLHGRSSSAQRTTSPTNATVRTPSWTPQQTGTRSAHLTIQSIGSRFSDWSLDWLHNRANDLIAGSP